jgi:hypothetical protein
VNIGLFFKKRCVLFLNQMKRNKKTAAVIELAQSTPNNAMNLLQAEGR